MVFAVATALFPYSIPLPSLHAGGSDDGGQAAPQLAPLHGLPIQDKATVHVFPKDFDPEHGTLGDDDRGFMLAPLSQLPKWYKGGRLQTGVDFHIGSIKPNVVRGNHRHYQKTELIMVWGCEAKWRLERKDNSSPYEEFIISPENRTLVEVPPGIAHTVKNVGNKTDCAIMDLSDLRFDPDVSDDFEKPVWPELCEEAGATC